jgi:hypothetical protein
MRYGGIPRRQLEAICRATGTAARRSQSPADDPDAHRTALQQAQTAHKRAMKHHRALGEHHQTLGDQIDKMRSLHRRLTSTLAELGFEDNTRVQRTLASLDQHIGKADAATEDCDEAHSGLAESLDRAQRCVRSVLDGAQSSEPDSEDADDAADQEKAEQERAARVRRAKALKLQAGGS